MDKTDSFDFKELFKERVVNDTRCLKNSLALFFLNVDCKNITENENLNKFFGDGLYDTLEFLKNHTLHTYVVWLSVIDFAW